MAHTITVRQSLTVDQGPRVTATRTLQLDAVDILDVTIPADGDAHEVEVQPADGPQLRLLAVTASGYDPPLGWAADGGAQRQLDQPLVLAGESIASLIGSPANTIAFTNAGGDDRTVQILIGRHAVDEA